MNKAILLAWFISSLSSSSTTPAFLTNKTLDLAQYAFERAAENNINPEMFVKLIDCESKWKSDAKGDWRSETQEYMATGILQFWKNTFIVQSKKYDLRGSYKNPEDQIDLAVLMLKEKDGYRHWLNCWKFINN